MYQFEARGNRGKVVDEKFVREKKGERARRRAAYANYRRKFADIAVVYSREYVLKRAVMCRWEIEAHTHISYI